MFQKIKNYFKEKSNVKYINQNMYVHTNDVILNLTGDISTLEEMSKSFKEFTINIVRTTNKDNTTNHYWESIDFNLTYNTPNILSFDVNSYQDFIQKDDDRFTKINDKLKNFVRNYLVNHLKPTQFQNKFQNKRKSNLYLLDNDKSNCDNSRTDVKIEFLLNKNNLGYQFSTLNDKGYVRFKDEEGNFTKFQPAHYDWRENIINHVDFIDMLTEKISDELYYKLTNLMSN